MFAPFSFKVNEPPMVAYAFLDRVKALLLDPLEVPFPTTKRRSVPLQPVVSVGV